MAEVKAARVREDVDGLYRWTVGEGDTAVPLIVDFRRLTAIVPAGVALEGALDPAGAKWFVLHARELPLTALRPEQLVAVQERVYHVRPVGVGETWLHMGGK